MNFFSRLFKAKATLSQTESDRPLPAKSIQTTSPTNSRKLDPPNPHDCDSTRLSTSTSASNGAEIDSTRISTSINSANRDDETRVVALPHTDNDATRIISSTFARSESINKPIESERFAIGDMIADQYEVLAIHRGSMGVVYGAFDHKDNVPRALKMLQERHSQDKNMRELFIEEASTWVRLKKHPFIVRAYKVIKIDGAICVITEYIRGNNNIGTDLRSILGNQAISLVMAVECSLQIAQAMQHAVKIIPGLVHRDLKPANILLDNESHAMVTDFGLVSANDVSAGTPAYMAPEQWLSESLDSRTDIYAWGCILFELFTGHRMFDAHSDSEWEQAHLTLYAPPATSIKSSIPTYVSDFISKCLKKNPNDRPISWDDVVSECANWFNRLTGLPIVLDYSENELDAQEFFNAGSSFLALNKPQEALLLLERSVELEPRRVGTIGFIGFVHMHFNQNYEKALDAFGRSLHINPDSVYELFNSAYSLFRLGMIPEATSFYQKAISADKTHSYPWNAEELVSQLSALSIGCIVKGVINSLTQSEAGLFLGGVNASIPTSHVAWKSISHPSELLAVGDIVTAVVFVISANGYTVLASMKQLDHASWCGISTRYPIGTRIKNRKVTAVTEFGFYIEVEDGKDGLVFPAETPSNIKGNIRIGDRLDATVIHVDENKFRIGLSMIR